MWRHHPSRSSFMYKRCSPEQRYFSWHCHQEGTLVPGRRRDSLGALRSLEGEIHILLRCLLSEALRNQEGVNFCLNLHETATSGSPRLWKQLAQDSSLCLPIPKQEANFNQYLWSIMCQALGWAINA